MAGMEEQQSAKSPTIRCVVQQLALPKYRVPFFLEVSKRRGIDILVLYSNTDVPNAEAPAELSVHYRDVRDLPLGMWWDGPLIEMLRREAFDVVVLAWNTRHLGMTPAIRAAKRHGMGVVLWGHGYSKNESWWRKWLRNRTARMADAIVTYTPSVAERCVREGISGERVFCAINSLDQTEIQAARKRWLDDPDRLRAFRETQGLGDRPVVLFVSRLHEPNRTDLLIEAASLLRDRLPDLLVAIVGKGPDLERLQRFTADLGMEDSVRFVGAIYDEAELAPWFLCSRAFCYPKNIGLSLLHAFGYGLPAVTSDHIPSHNPEIEAFKDGTNGLFYRDGNTRHLAEQLGRLIEDGALRQSLGDGAHQTVTEEFTTQRMGDGMERAIRYASARAGERRGIERNNSSNAHHN